MAAVVDLFCGLAGMVLIPAVAFGMDAIGIGRCCYNILAAAAVVFTAMLAHFVGLN